MSRRSLLLVKKFIASAIIAGLIITAPGLGCYQAFAQTVNVTGKTVTGTGTAGARVGKIGVNGVSRIGAAGQLHVTLGAGSLTPSLILNNAPKVSPSEMGVSVALDLPGVVFVPGVTAEAVAGQALTVTPVKNIAVEKAVAIEGRLTPSVPGESALARTQKGMGEVTSGKIKATSFLGRLFHGGRNNAAIEVSVPGLRMGDLGGSKSPLTGLSRGRAISDDLDVPEAAVEKNRVPREIEGPKASRAPSTWLVVGLSIAGAVGAFFAAPFVAGALGALIPAWITAHAVATPVIISIGLGTMAGGLIGLAASQYQVWGGYPAAVFSAAKTAAASTFRFWARFGRIFDAVITSRDMDEAMKAPLSRNLFKHPVLAWPFVLIGYGAAPLLIAGAFAYFGVPLASLYFAGAALVFGGAPVAFVAGLVYKAVGTPFRAMYLGVKQVILDFFPWMRKVLRLIRRMLAKAIPFLGGFFWGGIRAEGIAIAVGAMSLVRPIWENVVSVDYKAYDDKGGRSRVERLAEIAGTAILQLAGLVGIAAAGVVGGAMGLVFGLPYMFVEAWVTAFEKTEIGGKFADTLKAWHGFLEDEEGWGELSKTSFGKKGKDEGVSLGSGITRLFNSLGHALYALPATMVMAVVAFIRTSARALRFARTGEKPLKTRAPKLGGERKASEAKAQEKSAEKGESSLWPPVLLATVGTAFGLVGAYSLFLKGTALTLAALSNWPVLLILGAGAAIGGGIGLAVSQPKSWKGYLPSIVGKAYADAAAAFRSWARLGVSSDAALRNAEIDPNLERDAPAGLGNYRMPAWPSVIVGYPAAALSYLGGGILQAVGVPLQAAWQGMVVILTAGLIRRILRAIKKVITKGIPFLAGFVWGGIRGLAFTAWGGAMILAGPIFKNSVDPDGDYYMKGSIPRLIAVRVVQGMSVILGLFSGLVGLVVGAVYGLPVTLTMALAKGVRWSSWGGKLEESVRIWERETYREETERIAAMAEIELGKGGVRITYWEGFVRAGNALTNALLSWLWAPLIAVVPWARSAYRASRYAKSRDSDKSVRDIILEIDAKRAEIKGLVAVEDSYGRRNGIKLVFENRQDLDLALKAGLVSYEMQGYPVEFQIKAPSESGEVLEAVENGTAGRKGGASAPVDYNKGAVAALVLGLIGSAAASYGAYAVLLPLMGLAGWWAVGGYAAAVFIGGGIGLAVSQPSVWRNYPSVVASSVRSAIENTGEFWGKSGDAYARVLTGADKAKSSPLGLVHYAVGAVKRVVWALAGALHGLVKVPVSAALLGARKVLESILPWIKDFFNLIRRIAKKVFPFIAGGIGGIIVGVVGTALFGALLLGRPWFKYVASEDLENGSISKWVGALLTKVVAVIAGVVSGVLGLGLLFGLPAVAGFFLWGVPGLAVGLVTALPFALTLSVSMAVQLAEIGGRTERFFDLWSKGSLRREMRRVNKLTDSHEFNEGRADGQLKIGDAWIRMANIFAGNFAASIAAVIASLVAYPRSIYRAIQDLRAGREVPNEPDYGDGGVVGKTVRDYSRGGRKVLSRVLGWGGVLFGAAMIISSFWKGAILAALWKGVLLGILAFPAGWVAGLVLGGLSGALVGMLIWMSVRLSQEPPANQPIKRD